MIHALKRRFADRPLSDNASYLHDRSACVNAVQAIANVSTFCTSSAHLLSSSSIRSSDVGALRASSTRPTIADCETLRASSSRASPTSAQPAALLTIKGSSPRSSINDNFRVISPVKYFSGSHRTGNSRENGKSRGPSALLRQPESPGSRDFHFNLARKPAVRGLVAVPLSIAIRARFGC